MTFERWQQLTSILYPALKLEPERRADFLAAACADDRYLRAQVEALLHYQEAGEIIVLRSPPPPAPPPRDAAQTAIQPAEPAQDNGHRQLAWLSAYGQREPLTRRIAALIKRFSQ